MTVTQASRAAVSALALLAGATGADAASVLYGLGDSITFGETDLVYAPSAGDRGYVGRFADAIAARTGERPVVRNFAIDGETASSFTTGIGRTPPVVGRTDDILAAENTSYADGLVPQAEKFAGSVADETGAGNTVAGITITLGFNEVAALASMPPDAALAAVPGTLEAYRANYAGVLTQIRDVAPDAPLYLLGYYNPFPADPASPAAPIFNTYGADLNGIVADLAGTFGATYVDPAPAFVGNEAAYTFLDDQPAGFAVGGTFGGVEPIGNVHPTGAGYDAIAASLTSSSVAPVPLPAALPALLAGLGALALVRRRSRAG